MDGEARKVCVFMQVFRNEETMYKAIDSVLAQTYANLRFCILVGPETRGDIEKYTAGDARVVLFDGCFGESYRVFYTRLKEIASAPDSAYLTVLDADDWYDARYVEELVGEAERFHADIAACGNFIVDSQGKTIIGKRDQVAMCWGIEETGIYFPYIYGFMRTIWGKLIRSALVASMDVDRIPDYSLHGGYGSDTIFMFNLLRGAKRMCISEKVLYYYRASPTGATNVFAKSRLNSDAFVFHYVEEVMKELGAWGETPERFLYCVYGEALKDTSRLLVRQEKPERAEGLLHIYSDELTKRLFARQRGGRLAFLEEYAPNDFLSDCYGIVFQDIGEWDLSEAEAEAYLRIFELFYDRWQGLFSAEEFRVLAKRKRLLDLLLAEDYGALFDVLLDLLDALDGGRAEACLQLLRRLAKTVALKPALQERDFAVRYAALLKTINQGEIEAACSGLRALLSGKEPPYRAAALTELWSNLAAQQGDAAEFVAAKEHDIHRLLEEGRLPEARSACEALKELGVADETLRELRLRLREKEGGGR